MQSSVKRWGNSAAVRIPTSVLAAAHVRLDEPVDVREEHGRIIIEPIRPTDYVLASLIDAITDQNRHESIDMGAPVGQEAW